MKDKYIFGGGDSDGLLGIATVLRVIDDAFFSFTTPRRVVGDFTRFANTESGLAYFVDIALDQGKYPELVKELKKRPDFETYFFDQHNLPAGVKEQDLPFTHVSIDSTVSGCENAYRNTGCLLSFMIPAIASLNDGLTDTPAIKKAEAKYGPKLKHNARILKFGLAYRMKDNRFKKSIVYEIKNGRLPQEIPELVQNASMGEKRFEEIKRLADGKKITRTNITHGVFANFRGGYANMVAAYLAESTDRPVGISILETDRFLQKLNLVAPNKDLNLGKIVHTIALQLGGVGGGSVSSAGATLETTQTTKFLDRLDLELSKTRK